MLVLVQLLVVVGVFFVGFESGRGFESGLRD